VRIGDQISAGLHPWAVLPSPAAARTPKHPEPTERSAAQGPVTKRFGEFLEAQNQLEPSASIPFGEYLKLQNKRNERAANPQSDHTRTVSNAREGGLEEAGGVRLVPALADLPPIEPAPARRTPLQSRVEAAYSVANLTPPGRLFEAIV